MAQAVRSLSPKRIQEKIRKHRSAVMTLAMQAAKRSVLWQLRARGEKVNQYSARDLALMAAVELELNPRFVAVAVEAINTHAGFADCRLPDCAELESDAQAPTPHKSTTSTVQMLGAE